MDKQALLGSLHSQITDLQKMVKDMAQSGSIHQLDKDMFKNKIIILYEDALKLQKIDNIRVQGEQKPVNIPQATFVPEPAPVPVPVPEPVSAPKPQAKAPEAPIINKTPPAEETIVAPKPNYDPIPTPPKQDLTPLGEKIKPQKEAVNEIYSKAKASTKSTANPQPISDILIAIGLNDRFLFTRELFGNNSALFKSTVSKLNNMSSFDEATAYLSEEFNWNDDEATTEMFIQIVKRRFL